MKKSGIILAALLALAGIANAQSGKAVTLRPKLNVRTVNQLMAYERLHGPKLPIRKLKDNETEHEYYRGNLAQHPGSPAVAQWPVPQNDVSVKPPITPMRKDMGPMFSVPVNFGGPTLPESGYIPPDSTGDVSKASVIVAANGRIKSYDRLGNLGSLNMTTDLFFASLSPTNGTSDPRVVYDRLSDRWFVSIIDLANTNNKILLAISDNGTISGGTVWKYVSFAQNVGSGPNGFADYCTLGVDANGVYFGSNRFGGPFNCDVFAVRKADLLLAVPVVVVTPFRTMISTTTGTGMFTPWPCTNDDPAANVALVVAVDNAAFGLLSYRRITHAAGVFTISANATLSVPTTGFPLPMPNATSATQNYPLDALDDRLFHARVFRNRLTGAVTVHTASGIVTNSAGVGGTGDRSAARWYNLGNVFSGSLTLNAAGTVVDGAAGPKYCTIPSTAMNGQGNQFIGFSMGNLTNAAGIGGSYREVGDPGVTAPTLITAGAQFYKVQGLVPTASDPEQRWGDYSFTVVDPRDMMSIWSFQELSTGSNATNVNGSWQVRGFKVLAPAPTVSTLAPNNANQGQTTNVVVTGTGIFDPDGTYPDHLAFSFGANITVNTVTWNSATQATVNITVGAGAATGVRTITMTNPDGQTATASFTVNAAGPKTVSGALTLLGYLPASPLIAGSQFVFEIRDAGTNALLETAVGTTTAGHQFSFPTNQPAGTYKLRIKGVNRFMAKSQTLTLTATGATGLAYTLLNGDANGDNVVGNADFNILRAAFGGLAPNAPYNVAADFNGDGVVGNADFNILRTYFGQNGDN